MINHVSSEWRGYGSRQSQNACCGRVRLDANGKQGATETVERGPGAGGRSPRVGAKWRHAARWDNGCLAREHVAEGERLVEAALVEVRRVVRGTRVRVAR